MKRIKKARRLGSDPLIAHCELIDRDVVDLWSAVRLDFDQIVVPEVCFGLLTRQAGMAKLIIRTPGIWNAIAGPIILRCMADILITLGWILKDSKIRAENYVRYGLGQVKLQLEHRKNARPEDIPFATINEKAVELFSAWLDSQRYSFLTEVNVGSWSGISVREMAEEADLLDIYNYSYVPLSGAVHSMWLDVDINHLAHCRNPLHRFHRVPRTDPAPLDPSTPILASRYWNRTARLVANNFAAEAMLNSADVDFEAVIASLFKPKKKPRPRR